MRDKLFLLFLRNETILIASFSSCTGNSVELLAMDSQNLDLEKVPSCIWELGNTCSVCIPLTIVNQLQGKVDGSKKMLLSGFGVGMSWASCVMDFEDCWISDLVEV